MRKRSIDFSGASTTTGVGAFQATMNGSIAYDTGTLVPTRLYLSTRTIIQNGTRSTTVDSQLASTLRDDSFRKT